jgi:hypothetical protein
MRLSQRNFNNTTTTTAAAARATVPPSMDNPLHTSSPMEAEKDFIQSRLRYMMDWTEKTGVKTGSTTAKPTEQEGKNAPINIAS